MAELKPCDRLDAAISTALFAHSGQRDKGGNPYIAHPLRVMSRFANTDHQIVAVLHDVVEDSGLTINQIADDFGQTVADAVDALTRRDGETYEAFIERCRHNPIACAVKMVDLDDNMDLARLGRTPTEADWKRFSKYQAARQALSKPTPEAWCSDELPCARFTAVAEAGDRLAEAMEPFAKCCEQISSDEDDEEWAKFRLLIKHYRFAAQALAYWRKAKGEV